MTTQLEQFRQQLYERFPARPDALMNLLDALSGNTMAHSVVELSLNPPFRHGYGSVYTAIHHFFQASCPLTAAWERRIHEQEMIRLIAPYLPAPEKRKFWLLGLDVTPAPRPFSDRLEDRTFVYAPNPIKGNKPVAIGHQYSTLVAFPEKEHPKDPAWVVPLCLRRVPSQQTGPVVGAQQVEALLGDETLPFGDVLCVEVADSAYSVVPHLGRLAGYDNLVVVARMRGNRTVYRKVAQPEGEKPPPGHPSWYGDAFKLSDHTTWGPPDQLATTRWTTRKGRTLIVHLQGWHNLIMPGTRQFDMHNHPFTLLRARIVDEQGKLVFQRPSWLVVFGKRRDEICLVEAFDAYSQRYDLEHFFRFGKQRLLMSAYQSPIVEHEENWWSIVQWAYVQLWLARSLARAMPRPWERYLPQPQTGIASPTTVQRDFGRIIRQIGTPAAVPKPRGYSPGREKGQRQKPRIRHPVIKKAPAKPKRASRAA